MKNIAIVGFMGTGKTTIARILAEKLGFEYVDIDDLIEKQEKMKIVDIFKEKGKAYFRKIEKAIISHISASAQKVIACGGGVVLDQENMRNLKDNGVVVCLTARPEVILMRTKNYRYRPLLNVSDPKAEIEELLKIRQPYYAKAEYTLDTSELQPEEVVKKIREWIGTVDQDQK